jgi:hypothetical protein
MSAHSVTSNIVLSISWAGGHREGQTARRRRGDHPCAALWPCILLVLALIFPVFARAQSTENVLYTFSGTDGSQPAGQLTKDCQGNLYGVTTIGGGTPTGCVNQGCGVVFELSPPAGGVGAWTGKTLYSFTGGSDGGEPNGGMVLDAQGNLYGTTVYGGNTAACPALYSYQIPGCGVAFKLSPSGGGGAWTETVLYAFAGPASGGFGADGYGPNGVIFDSSGDLYGATRYGGTCEGTEPYGCGTAFELTPPSGGAGPWSETVLYDFADFHGTYPTGSLVFDASGDLYGDATFGTTTSLGNNCVWGLTEDWPGCGLVFELSPQGSGSPWKETILDAFTNQDWYTLSPSGSIAFDHAGNLYVITNDQSSPWLAGSVLELIPPAGSGTWTETVLYRIPTNGDDGLFPLGGPLIDADGNIFAVMQAGGGDTGRGAVFEVRPNGLTPMATTISLASTPNPATYGQNVTFTATVSPASGPTGSVSFFSDSNYWLICGAVPLARISHQMI